MGIIYKVTDEEDGRIYIGQTSVPLKTRMKRQLSNLKRIGARKSWNIQAKIIQNIS